MKKRIVAVIAALSLALSGCAVNYSVQPDALAQQSVRYDRGTPTILDDREKGSIQMTPLGVGQDGRLVFGIAVFNKGTASANYGIENVSASDDAQNAVKTYTKDELASEARTRAAIAAFATVLAGAAAAYGAQQNAYQTTNGTVITPRGGIATFTATTYNPTAAALGTAAAGAATGYTLASIKNSMDATLDHLNGAILQMTTVDPGQSYGGEVVIDMPKGRDFPKKLSIHSNWNGETYEFDYSIARAK